VATDFKVTLSPVTSSPGHPVTWSPCQLLSYQFSGTVIVDQKRVAELDKVVPLQALLGYLNFSEGRPDPRFQKQLNDAYAFLAGTGRAEPWKDLAAALQTRLRELRGAPGGPFRDARQVEAILTLTFDHLLPAYRRHHSDLLFHLSDRELLQPFFLARACEAVLAQGGPWTATERITRGALNQLNDFVGYRPIAILETRPRGEPYEHERVRPIPLYLKGAGVAWGRYRDLVEQALAILKDAEPALLADACFDPELLDELALDPRAYDHNHPVNRRPNYVFGEWDPHHLDNQGRYRRFVVRPVTLEGLLERAEKTPDRDRGELLFEAAAVLAGTILMASGISGGGPIAHDSFTTLSTLMPKIARYRDAFYVRLLETRPGEHGERLRRELTTTRQHFGGARQHLNQYLARQRAAQLQQRHLALLFAEMGYADASRRQAAQIPAVSIRILSELQCRLTTGLLLVRSGKPAEAAKVLPEVEDLLQRGIAAGALVDPWNILGFQALFPLSPAQEDSMRDPRVDELIYAMAAVFSLYDRLLSEAAGTGAQDLVKKLVPQLQRFAAWWDRFATTEVGDVRHVNGAAAATSAEQVAAALAQWHARGGTSDDLAFWRDQQQNFRSPKAFALVVDTLLRKQDHQAALALLVTWVGQVEQVPLEEGMYSFHDLALRWLLGVVRGPASGTAPAQGPDSAAARSALVKKFFDYLEANAEDFWHVPELDLGQAEAGEPAEENDLYGAAYEDVTYQDSTDDQQEGAVFEGEAEEEFVLDPEADRIGHRLRFLATVARLWHVAVQGNLGASKVEARVGPEDIAGWLSTARRNYQRLLLLLDAVHAVPVPEPSGTYESNVEYDRRRGVKEQLLYQAIHTCHDTFLAMGTLQSLTGEEPTGGAPSMPSWGPAAAQLEAALMQGDAAATRKVLPGFLALFEGEPLLFTALAEGGHPRQILRVRIAQTILRSLSASLPRLGLVRETFHLVRTARTMEQAHPANKGVSQFNDLFQMAFQSAVEAIVEAAPGWGPPEQWSTRSTSPKTPNAADAALAELLEKVGTPFFKLWIDHSQTLRLSYLETVRGDAWEELRGFIRRYGRELFNTRFMTLANLRGILLRGAGSHLDYLRENQDPLHPVQLVEDLGHTISREKATEFLEIVLHALIENYEEFKDYNTTTTQSDDGENLHLLLDFLRLKATYERHAWNLRPLVMVHEVLVRKNLYSAAKLWREAFIHFNRALAEQHVQELGRLEQTHAMRLRTVADRIQERFVKQLDLDRLCALAGPAMDEADRPEHPSFVRLEAELQPYRDSPAGVGLDVPHWLRRLEQEVQRVWNMRSALAALAEHFARVPRRPLAFAELDEQLREWDQA
jgi:hypothetical protein